MTGEKYSIENDLYCYPGSTTLRNLLNLQDDASLADAERDLTALAAATIEFLPPPYDLDYVKSIHRHVFAAIYPWAGELRSVDISKGQTRFCTSTRIEPEAKKLFRLMSEFGWFEGISRHELVHHVAEVFGDFNVVHPFREGNGRAQRILFEHIIINAGYEISWRCVEPASWIAANVAAYHADSAPLRDIFERCIGGVIPEAEES